MKQTLIFLLLTVLACGSASATWPQTRRSDFSERYEVITLTPAMPVPVRLIMTATKGLRLIGLRRDGNGQYTEVTRQFSLERRNTSVIKDGSTA